MKALTQQQLKTNTLILLVQMTPEYLGALRTFIDIAERLLADGFTDEQVAAKIAQMIKARPVTPTDCQ